MTSAEASFLGTRRVIRNVTPLRVIACSPGGERQGVHQYLVGITLTSSHTLRWASIKCKLVLHYTDEERFARDINHAEQARGRIKYGSKDSLVYDR